MIDEHKLLRDRARQAEAQSLLDNVLFNEALATLEADYIKAWKATPLRDTDGRERVWQAVQIVGKIKDHLGSVMTSGKVAAKQLEDLVEDDKRKIRWLGR